MFCQSRELPRVVIAMAISRSATCSSLAPPLSFVMHRTSNRRSPGELVNATRKTAGGSVQNESSHSPTVGGYRVRTSFVAKGNHSGKDRPKDRLLERYLR